MKKYQLKAIVFGIDGTERTVTSTHENEDKLRQEICFIIYDTIINSPIESLYKVIDRYDTCDALYEYIKWIHQNKNNYEVLIAEYDDYLRDTNIDISIYEEI